MRTNLHLCCLLAVLLTPTVCAQQAPVFQSTIPSPNDIGVVKNIQSNMNYYDGTMQSENGFYNEPVLSISDMYKLLKSNSPTFADTKIDFEPDVFPVFYPAISQC